KINPDEVGRETLIDSIRKQIEKIIKQVGIESVGVGKSTPASKRLAKTYSKETKDTLLDDYLFDYFLGLSQDESVKKYVSPAMYEEKAREYNGRYEDKYLEFLKKMDKLGHDAMMKNQESNMLINEHDSLIREKKKEIMLEALFSKFYSLNIDDLVEDTNKVEDICYYKQGNFDANDMRAIERFKNWESYVEEK
ncbi:hypothetical protein PGJ43_002240, partial [Enterococcus faecalis]|nr:hypothetical protein [Enterococcus faecalis]